MSDGVSIGRVSGGSDRPSVLGGSFRDPSGFIYRDEQRVLLRQVNLCYERTFRQFIDSGLYQSLVDTRRIVEHQNVESATALTDDAAFVIRPKELPHISYPFEWCFSALKDAALLTLDIQETAIKHKMSLKDASSYNIQFDGVHPIFIDTLSFEPYEQGRPWSAYGQFCRHFLAPLALMAYVDIRHGRLLSLYLDGVPLDLAARMLPRRTKFSPGLAMHLHLHARMVARHSDTSIRSDDSRVREAKVSQDGLLAILGSLRKTITKLRWEASGTEWADYYQNNSYTSESFESKKNIVREMLSTVKPQTVWDLGANTGVFSRIATEQSAYTLAFDIDPACVEMNYLEARKLSQQNLLPLLLDLTNPSPAIGWAHEERDSFAERGPADVVLALALIHHLAIANNVPLDRIAGFLQQLGHWLIIEFVPKNDPQSQRLLRSREDIFVNYDQENFETAFSEHFEIQQQIPVGSDGRVLYLMHKLA